MILTNEDIRNVLTKYEEDTTFNNEIVLYDVLNLVETIRYWKKQTETLKNTSFNHLAIE